MTFLVFSINADSCGLNTKRTSSLSSTSWGHFNLQSQSEHWWFHSDQSHHSTQYYLKNNVTVSVNTCSPAVFKGVKWSNFAQQTPKHINMFKITVNLNLIEYNSVHHSRYILLSNTSCISTHLCSFIEDLGACVEQTTVFPDTIKTTLHCTVHVISANNSYSVIFKHGHSTLAAQFQQLSEWWLSFWPGLCKYLHTTWLQVCVTV